MSYQTNDSNLGYETRPAETNIHECPRCGDNMIARDLDFVCNECMVRVEKED